MPRGADFAARVAGGEEPEELRASVIVESFIGFGQQPSAPIERVVFAAPMTARLVLHAAAALVEFVVREFHNVERIRDLDSVRQHRVEHQPIRT